MSSCTGINRAGRFGGIPLTFSLIVLMYFHFGDHIQRKSQNFLVESPLLRMYDRSKAVEIIPD